MPLILHKQAQIAHFMIQDVFNLVVIQIIYGAFVAGLNAGIGFNTWPKMNGEWIPQAVYSLDPLWKNFIEAPYGIQFVHRVLALIIVSFVLFIWFKNQSTTVYISSE